MTLLLELDRDGATHVHGETPPRPPPVRATPANTGHGDVRKKIVPVIKPPAGPSTTDWEGGRYLSQDQWLEGAEQGGAILLQPADDPRKLAGRLDTAALIAVDFHRIGDGRGYSHAFWLRNRLEYKGPLRAVGAVTADQVFAMARVGFNSFALRPDQNGDAAIAALRTFTVPYQGAAVAGNLRERADAIFEARVRLLELALAKIASNHSTAQRLPRASPPRIWSSPTSSRASTSRLMSSHWTPDVCTQETVELIGETERRYTLSIERVQPDAGSG